MQFAVVEHPGKGQFALAALEGCAVIGAKIGGVFAVDELNGGDLDDVFSGIFNASKTFGNEGKDTFSGLFMEGSLVDGGNGNDKFTGRFIHSDIEAGEGNDELGNFRMTQGAQEFQFVASRINMGEGDNLMRTAALNSRIDMGEGENRIFGVLQGSSVRNESGNAKITALLSLSLIHI